MIADFAKLVLRHAVGCATHTDSNMAWKVQGLPDAVAPESVLSLVDRLQAEALEAAEQLGQKNNELADLKGKLMQWCSRPQNAG